MRPPGAASPSAKSNQEDEIPLSVMAGRIKKFSENTSTIPEVIWTLHILSFHDFFFGGGGDPRRLRVCASKPWSMSIAYVKFSGRSTP